ncbi:amino acid adenylation domain-containing protein [Streptomyces sp. TRM66268-LWL]|uniref:Amino acid adenylation domain-containing protein n=1 Tax=Streptomyces polyasparticus TaxID=2767826 RepID=A0ABR7SN05_9ACTN|nr:amino acid adenylation domain-containing protein [Streptomyces polyasparticus]MBC9716065.1 amino acid adenylation domain-containing protein [Streptomyces polyasparticus]
MTAALRGGGAVDSAGTTGAPRTAGTLPGALTAHAHRTPDRPALIGPDARLTYGELYARAAAIAVALQRRGVGPGDRVAVHGEKTAGAVTALLGAVLAGAAYLPLDPAAPAERRRMLVEDAAASCLLASGARARQLTEQNLATSVLVIDELAATEVPADWRPARPAPEDLVYVLYTSGSTGRPKGVCIHHHALDTFFEAVDPVLGITADAVCLNTTALHFDGSVADLLLPLVRGAKVFLGPQMPLPKPVLDLIQRERVTHMTGVGSTLTLLAQHGAGLGGHDLSSLRTILTGAEVLNPATVQAWLHAAPDLVVVNGYGPTETTCGVAFHPISEREPGRTELYPIGAPLPGVELKFRTPEGQFTDHGPGELYIGGDQVMTGYLNRPVEEAGVFVRIDGKRYYRSGDIVERRPDGVLLFEGRRDDEVKIRGYRINLNEVRTAVESHPSVGHAFVAAVPDPRDKLSLACAIVPRQAPAGAGRLEVLADKEAAELTEHTAALLPRYMVPRQFHLLSAFPVLPSGKPDSGRVRELLKAAL